MDTVGETYMKRVLDRRSTDEKRMIARALASGNVEHRMKVVSKVLLGTHSDAIELTTRECAHGQSALDRVIEMLMCNCYADENGNTSWTSFSDDLMSEPLANVEGMQID